MGVSEEMLVVEPGNSLILLSMNCSISLSDEDGSGPPSQPQWVLCLPSTANRTDYIRKATSPDAGFTGTVTVLSLVVLLWSYSMYRMWLVWVTTLNFDGAGISGPRGWDFLFTWLHQRIQHKKRTGKVLESGNRHIGHIV